MSTELKPDSNAGTLTETQSRTLAVTHCNEYLASISAEDRISWALAKLPGTHVLSSSFGAQAAVSLHLLTRQIPNIPVIFTDTGYLFPETYRFVDQLADRLNLNLKIYRSHISGAWQEARYGERWAQTPKALAAYNGDNKVEPMKRALKELSAGTWFAGLRREQASTRSATPFIEFHGERWKVHPIADWSDREVHRYLARHDLPYHPLWSKGYVSVGDVHSTRPLHEVGDLDETRFPGFKRECGLHEINMDKL